MLTSGEIEAVSMALDKPFKALEMRIMKDIVRRIKINGEITRSADWQITRLLQLGMSMNEIENYIQTALGFSDEDMHEMYSNIIGSGYARDKKLYEAVGAKFIPFKQNHELQQLVSAVAAQTNSTLKNITQSLGFAVRQPDGKLQFIKLSDYYQKTLDNAMLDISSGAFDYNTVLKRTVKEMTNSGLRTVDYASGWSNRVDVAARRAVMTGMSQLTAKVNEDNAQQLGTDMFEVTWHSGARPEHQVWQGRWYTRKQLETVCGLGTVTGLCGANCYHDYYPVIPGISEPTYTDEELTELNAKENTPMEYNGKQYTKYEALQRQRRLETTMRAQRQEIKLLKDGGASEDDLINARARYRGTSHEYAKFSQAMGLPQQRERVAIDGLGNIWQGKYTGGSGKESPAQAQPVGAKVMDKVTDQERLELLSRNKVDVRNSSIDNSGRNDIIEKKSKPITTIEEAHDYLNSVFSSVENNVSKLDEQLIIDNTEQLRNLNDRFGVLTSENTGYVSGSRKKAIAETYQDPSSSNNNLTFSNTYYKSPENLVATEKIMQNQFYSMPVADKYLRVATITHEYGHMLENEIIRSRIDKNLFNEYQELRAKGKNKAAALIHLRQAERIQAHKIFYEIVEIAKQSNPDFRLSGNLSKYGKTNYLEAFAEIFMNSQCGNPNELGKAMNIFLEKSGY